MPSSRCYENVFIEAGYEEVIVPVIWEQSTFVAKSGQEILNQMWTFQDKGNRDVCLIPEVTGIFQELWRNSWGKEFSRKKIFYVSRCYRYETPQAGRYREFTQFGIENLGKVNDAVQKEVTDLLQQCLNKFNLDYKFNESVKRGLSYYTDYGFEVECANLGAQKQIAGGGAYAEGIGWAIGVDRLLLAEA